MKTFDKTEMKGVVKFMKIGMRQCYLRFAIIEKEVKWIITVATNRNKKDIFITDDSTKASRRFRENWILGELNK